MKCPYCNYVSFDYLNTCRKCSRDLTAHKSQYGIDFLEPVSLGALAAAGGAAAAMAEEATASFDTGDFSFDTETSEGVVIGGEEEAAAEALPESDEGFQLDIGESAEQETGQAEARMGGGTDEDLSAALGESTDEISLQDIETGEGIEISTEPEEEEASTGQVEQLASDSGFSLNLGEDFSEDSGLAIEEPPPLPEPGESVIEEAPEEEGISLESAGLGEIELAEEPAGQIDMESAEPLAPEEEPGEIIFEEPAGEEAPEITIEEEEENEPAGEDLEISLELEEDESGATGREAEEDFADIELGAGEKELFEDEERKDEGEDEEIDLGDLDLQIGDEDLDDLKFD